MDDIRIIDLFFKRDESAIAAFADKYKGYCAKIARNILDNQEDTEECLNDTYMRIWDSIPPNKPDNLQAFAGKITRNLAIDAYKKKNASKRGGVQNVDLVLDELDEMIPSEQNIEEGVIAKDIINRINYFLYSLEKEQRVMFVLRYFYGYTLDEISKRVGCPKSTVHNNLEKTRNSLKLFLERGAE